MGKILNIDVLASNPLRRDALAIAEAGLEAIDTRSVVRTRVSLDGDQLCVRGANVCSLAATKRIFIIGIGKCAAEAGSALEDVLGEKLVGGLVFDVSDRKECVLRKLECFVGTHPMPSEQNVDIARRVRGLLKDLTEEDLALFVISGGGSSLLCLPEEGALCVEEEMILKELFRAGAPIQEINVIRKHLSLARGGHLAEYAYPAQVISLIFSDVPGNDISVIASGPTVKDNTTIADADRILAQYSILETCGLEHCGLIETPKDDKYFANVQNILFLSNDDALEAMRQKAEILGYTAMIKTDKLSGEAREVGVNISRELHGCASKTALLYGGETTVVVRGTGNGGRNQELALAAAEEIDEDEIVLALGSDGRDNGEHAGAIGDVLVREHAAQHKISLKDYLNNNDSFNFFQQTGDALLTGYTGSNVSDLIIALKGQD